MSWAVLLEWFLFRLDHLERAFSTFAGLFLLLLIFHSAPSRHRYFGTHAVSGVKDPLAKACGAQFAGCDKHPAAPLVSHPIGTPLHSWSLPHRHSAAPPGPHPSSLPPAKSWCPGHSIVAGLGGCVVYEWELLQGRSFISNVFLFLWLVRWFLFCSICCLSSLACMLKLALHFHFSPSLILMQAAM